jgi:hypothetical protein
LILWRAAHARMHGCRTGLVWHFSLPNVQAPLQITPWFTGEEHLTFWADDAAAPDVCGWTHVRVCPAVGVAHPQHVTNMHQLAGTEGTNVGK